MELDPGASGLCNTDWPEITESTMRTKVSADLRSDTVTQQTPAMRKVIAEAVVGDDVFGDDPSVNELQEKTAALLGQEAALFVPSGMMANQIAIRIHTSHGDEVICQRDSHAFYYESGAPAALSGVSVRFIEGRRGQFDGADVQALLRPPNDHFAPSRLVIIENTHNRGGGSVWPIEMIADVAAVARKAGLAMHLDGARLFNASVATGVPLAEYARHFDTVSMCFSKGLGAPVGSILAGSKDSMQAAHRFRKLFGGGMRQAGLLAAAATYALDHHIDRLAEDHANAKTLAVALAEFPTVTIDPDEVETNILFFEVDPRLGTAGQVCERLREAGVLLLPESATRLRGVTHLDVSADQIEQAIPLMREVLK